MPLHVIKLCVGVETFEELDRWFREEELAHASRGLPYQPAHTTRMFPKRAEEILGGGSLYWVIKGIVQARQRILDLRPVKGADGIERCDIVLEPVLHRTEYQPRRAFQGWRYLDAKDAPPDIRRADHGDDIPEGMRQELRRLALI